MQQPNGDQASPRDKGAPRRRRPHPARQARLVAGVASASAMVGLVLGLANRPQSASAQASTASDPSALTASSAPSADAATASSATSPTTTQRSRSGQDDSRSWSDEWYSGSDDGGSSGAYRSGSSSSSGATSPPTTAIPPTVTVTPRAHTSSHGS